MRVLFAVTFCTTFFCTSFARGDSHPSWWRLATPDATALVGIQWEQVRSSPFGEPVRAELWGAGSLGFPDIACLLDARQILISSPPLLAIATVDCPAVTLRGQALAKGMAPASYHGVALWISRDKSTLSVALLDEALLLIGSRKTLEVAIARSTEAGRHYSPLLSRAARFSQRDLWVVATQLPDPLASLFVPLDAPARGFEGGVSLRDGLQFDATLDAGSEDGAAVVADEIGQSIPTLPSIARSMEVATEANQVILTLDVSRDQFAASLRSGAAAALPNPIPSPPAPIAATPAVSIEPAKPAGPQIIHIYGLDEGTREIILPPVKQPERQ